MKTMIFSFAISLLAVACFAQTEPTGSINGRVMDAANQEGISFGIVVLYQDNVQKATAQTDFDGYYFIRPVNPGVYDVRIQYTNYQVAMVSGIRVEMEKTTLQDIQMTAMESVPVVYIGHHDNCTPSRSTTTQNALAGAGTTDSVTTALNISGCRGSTIYYVGCFPMRESVSLPITAIEQIRVLTSGLPVRYDYSDENSLASCHAYTELMAARFRQK